MAEELGGAAGGGGALVAIGKSERRRVWRWAVVIALGGFLFGYDTGMISGALLFIEEEFTLSSFEQGSVVSVLLLGAMAGALGAGRLADLLGRRKAIRLTAVIFVVGAMIATVATDYWMLLLARLVLGLAVGAGSAIVPVYLSEVAPAQIRGRALTLNQMLITVGILASYIVDLAFSATENWRAMFAASAVPALALLIGSLWLPESPSWLIVRGRVQEGRAVMRAMAGAAGGDRLVELFQEGQRERREQRERDRQPERLGWRALLAPRVRPALTVGLVLAAVQQFGGINTIIYYAPTIIERTGVTASNSIFYAVFIGIINMLMTVVAIRLIDSRGRRWLLLVSMSGMLVTLLLLGFVFVTGLPSVLALVFMVMYIAAFAVGMGPVFWVMVGEVFPPAARSVGAGAATTTNWGSNFVVGLLFLPVVDVIGVGPTFWIFAVVCAFALWFIRRYVPETRNREFEQVDSELQARFKRHATPQTG